RTRQENAENPWREKKHVGYRGHFLVFLLRGVGRFCYKNGGYPVHQRLAADGRPPLLNLPVRPTQCRRLSGATMGMEFYSLLAVLGLVVLIVLIIKPSLVPGLILGLLLVVLTSFLFFFPIVIVAETFTRNPTSRNWLAVPVELAVLLVAFLLG